ncbi:MAG TPA: helix-turn-helix domain-containing protein [Actinomycetes bacterium]|nr:helix-turn-helix domain-containing protein [Actinomycetes bacterium]
MTVPSDPGPTGRRFLQLADVAEVLNISSAQVYALVRSGDLPAIKIGGRGQWRVEVSELEAYIARMYAETRDFVTTHRFGRPAEDGGPPGAVDDGDGDGGDTEAGPVTR